MARTFIMEYCNHVSQTIFILLFLSFCERTLQFNLETRLPVIKNGPAGGYFGFSVAEHITNPVAGPLPTDRSLFLVGAPIFQDDSLPFNRTGAVFRCPFTTQFNDCEKIEIENDAEDVEWDKNGEWLGVSIASQGVGGRVAACAHRYKQVTWNGDEIDKISPLGKCTFLQEDLTLQDESSIWVPCFNRGLGHGSHGYCQAGTGVSISKNTGRVADTNFIVGAPGAGYWQGLMAITTAIFQTWWSSIDDEDFPVPLNSYFGFSTSSGVFSEGQTYFIGGAPRANSKGAVLIMNKDVDRLVSHFDAVFSDAPYSSFGYSVAVADLNGDSFDDIVVGAPMYYNKTTKVGGAVYIYINEDKNGTFSGVTPTIITGPLDSRFGMSLTSLGDSNYDGFEDFAVGAPYENDGQGAVYIYLGGPDGVVQPWAQKITPSDLPTELQGALPPSETFGYSLSGGLDLDFNSFPDLLVGALDSESVVLLRGRPVITMDAKVNVTPSALDPESPNCEINGEQKLCFNIEVCARYFSDSAFDEEIEVLYTIEAESKRLSLGLNSRVYFEGGQPDYMLANQTLLLYRKTDEIENCAPIVQAILRDDFSDIYRSIPIRVTFALPQDTQKVPPPGDPLPDMTPTVMFDHSVVTTLATEVEFTKECAIDDGVCIADLVLEAEFKGLANEISDSDNPLLKVGVDSEMQLMVNIENKGEEAYDAVLIVEYSNHLTFTGLQEGATERVRYSCGESVVKEDANDTMVLRCKLGNPYPKKPARDHMVMVFDASTVPPDAGSLEFYLNADRTNDDSSPEDNEVSITVDVESVTDIQLDGEISKSQYFYGGIIRGESAIENEGQIGPLVKQKWTVFNHGPAMVDEITVTINFPYEVDNGKWLLYMVKAPVITAGEGTCDVDESWINEADIMPCTDNCTEQSGTKKRQTFDPSDYLTPDQVDPVDRVVLECDNGARCFPIVCVFQDLSAIQNENEAVIEISARLWNATFMEDFLQARRITVRISGFVEMANSSVVTQTNRNNDRDTANFDVVSPNLSTRTQGVAWWIILIAVLLGLLLLILLIVILWKCGFFERKTGYQYSSVTKKHTDVQVGTEKRQMYDEMYNYSAVPEDGANSPTQL